MKKINHLKNLSLYQNESSEQKEREKKGQEDAERCQVKKRKAKAEAKHRSQIQLAMVAQTPSQTGSIGKMIMQPTSKI